MRLSPTVIGTLAGVLAAGLVIPALSGADNVTTVCWALAPVALGFAVGLLIDLGRDPEPPNDPPRSIDST